MRIALLIVVAACSQPAALQLDLDAINAHVPEARRFVRHELLAGGITYAVAAPRDWQPVAPNRLHAPDEDSWLEVRSGLAARLAIARTAAYYISRAPDHAEAEASDGEATTFVYTWSVDGAYHACTLRLDAHAAELRHAFIGACRAVAGR